MMPPLLKDCFVLLFFVLPLFSFVGWFVSSCFLVMSSQECSHCHLCPASAVGIPSRSDSCDSMPPLSPEIGILFSEFGPTYAGFCLGLERGIWHHTSTNIVGKRLLAEKEPVWENGRTFPWKRCQKRYEFLVCIWLSAFSSICLYLMYFHFTCQYTLFIIRISLRTCSFFKIVGWW